MTSVSACSVRLSSPARLTLMPIGTTAASSARRGASSTTRPEPSRMGRSLKISPLMLFQVSSDGWSWLAAVWAFARDDPAKFGGPAKHNAAIKAGTITLEKIDMVEFRFHKEAAMNLSENPLCGKARSFPFEFAKRRNDVARTIFIEQLPLRLLASPGHLRRPGERYALGNQIAHFPG